MRFALAGLIVLSRVDGSEAAQCGSGLLFEATAPAAFQGLGLGPDAVARFWAEGNASANIEPQGCAVGCEDLGGGAVALTGVNWLNASCATAGTVPARTVFLLERTTASAGGLWGALDVDRGPADFNVDLDAKAQSICAGCSSVGASYLGGSGKAAAGTVTRAVDDLTVKLAWTAPLAAAQALSNSANLVKSYTVFYRRSASVPTGTGEKTGWTRVADSDGGQVGGYSTNAEASVVVPVAGSQDDIYFAVGLNLDGTGNPLTDGNTVESAYLSAPSVPTCLGTTAAVQGSYDLCLGNSVTLKASLTGEPPWNVTWSDGFVQSGIAASPASRVVSPAATTTYSLTTLTDNRCAGVVSGSIPVTVDPGPLCGRFFTLNPCRVIDTRNPDGPYGGPAMATGVVRTFAIAASQCSVPIEAKAIAINVTVIGGTSAGACALSPAGTGIPTIEAINYQPGLTRANNSVMKLESGTGSLAVRCVQSSGTVHFVLDVTGYFR